MEVTKPDDKPLLAHREQLNTMAARVLEESGVDFDRATQLEQALIGTFIFGMIYAHGMVHKMLPPQVHALAICVYVDTLHYTPQAAAQGVQECINATRKEYH